MSHCRWRNMKSWYCLDLIIILFSRMHGWYFSVLTKYIFEPFIFNASMALVMYYILTERQLVINRFIFLCDSADNNTLMKDECATLKHGITQFNLLEGWIDSFYFKQMSSSGIFVFLRIQWETYIFYHSCFLASNVICLDLIYTVNMAV